MRLFFINVTLMLTLTGCGLLSKSLLPTNELLLLPPELASKQGVLQQKVTMIKHDKTQTFVVITEFSAKIMRVVVLTPAGQRVLSMHYDGLVFESTNYTDMPIPAQEVFSLMQFAMWPEDVLARYYKPQNGWQAVLSPQQRHLLKWHDSLVKVWFEPAKTEVHHLRHHYQVVIEPLESH